MSDQKNPPSSSFLTEATSTSSSSAHSPLHPLAELAEILSREQEALPKEAAPTSSFSFIPPLSQGGDGSPSLSPPQSEIEQILQKNLLEESQDYVVKKKLLPPPLQESEKEKEAHPPSSVTGPIAKSFLRDPPSASMAPEGNLSALESGASWKGIALAFFILILGIVFLSTLFYENFLQDSPQKNTPPPVVKAQNTNFKIPPERSETTEKESISPSQKAIYARMSGAQPSAAEAELLPREEVPAQPKIVSDPPQEEEAVSQNPELGETEQKTRSSQITQEEEGFFPKARKVRTVSIQPDGTLLAPLASPSNAEEVGEGEEEGEAENATQVSSEPVSPSVSDASQTGIAQQPEETGASSSISTPLESIIPRQRPKFSGRVQEGSPDNTQTSSTETPSGVTDNRVGEGNPSAAQAELTPGTYLVQLSSQRSQEQAYESFSALKRRYPAIFEGRQVIIQTAEVEGKGTYYRLRIRARDQADAEGLCAAFQQVGGSCFVLRY